MTFHTKCMQRLKHEKNRLAMFFFLTVYFINSKFYEISTVINICLRKSWEFVSVKQSYQINEIPLFEFPSLSAVRGLYNDFNEKSNWLTVNYLT